MKFATTVTIGLVLFTNLVLSQHDDKFYFPKKELKEINFDNIEEYFSEFDQDTVNGLLLKPKSDKASIIFYHGAGGNISYYIKMVYPLIENGYQVYMFEPRGYGKSTGTPTHLNVAHDAQKVLDSLLLTKDFADRPLLLFGVSLGSQVATNMALKNQTKVDALILEGPMSSFTDIALESAPVEMHQVIKTYVTSPYSAKSDIAHIKNTPKLIIHSSIDKSVPSKHGKEIFNNACEPKIFWDSQTAHINSIIEKPVEFIAHLDKLMEYLK